MILTMTTSFVLFVFVKLVGAVETSCDLDKIFVQSSGGLIVTDLNALQCVAYQIEIRDMFRNVRAPGCSIGQNFFHRKNKACPEAFRRKMIGYVRSTLKESNGRLIASPLFALHVCQLGGAFSTTYKQDGDLTVIEDPCPDNSKYTLTTPGVQFCWKARIQLINRCVRTRDPMVSVQSGITNKRGVDLCAQKFKRMLDTSVPKRSTTWNAFSDRERDMIMPEAVLPFAMKKKETWCAFVLLYFFIFFERQIFLSLSHLPSPFLFSCSLPFPALLSHSFFTPFVSSTFFHLHSCFIRTDVDQDTLIPHPDTETLMNSMLTFVSKKMSDATDANDDATSLKLLDLYTGAGPLIVAALTELPHSSGVAIDISPGAVSVAQRNAVRHEVNERVSFLIQDLHDPLWCLPPDSLFDVVFANPPYIPFNERSTFGHVSSSYHLILNQIFGP